MRATRVPELGRLWPWTTALALSVSGFELTARLAPYSSASPLVAYAVGFGCVVASTLGACASVPVRPRACAAISVALGAALLAGYVAGRGGPLACAWAPLLLLALLAFGSMLGALVGGAIEHPGHLLFVAVVSGLADTFSVTQPHGLSAAIARSPAMLSLVALPWPLLGTRGVAPLLGVGDVVFTALYLATGRRHALPLRRMVLALACGYLVTMLFVIALIEPIPALPFLGASVLIAHPAARRPPAADARRGLWLLTVFAAAWAAWALRRGS